MYEYDCCHPTTLIALDVAGIVQSERCKPTLARVMPRNLTLAWVWFPASTNQFPRINRSLCEGGLAYERS